VTLRSPGLIGFRQSASAVAGSDLVINFRFGENACRNSKILDQGLGAWGFLCVELSRPTIEEPSLHLRVCEPQSTLTTSEAIMAEKDLNDLFLDTLKDIYYAEKQIHKSLPKMAKAANDDKLRAAFEKHHDETEGQIERLEQIFKLLGKPARGKKCDAIEGILDEGKEIMEEYEGAPALDAGLLAAAQAVEHYEISRYGTLKSWATKLGLNDAVKLIDQTLAEEKKTDDALTKLAETTVNYEAAA
jgi:ferritin-like metal-binding protein YciE